LVGRRSRGRLVILVAGAFLVLIGVALVIGGGVVLYLNQGTDREGYAMSAVYQVRSSASAFALWVSPMEITSPYLTWLNHEDIAQTKWVVKAVDPSKEIFVGWAKASDGEDYLWGNSIAYETPSTSWYWNTGPYYAGIEIQSTAVYGNRTWSRSPAEETFWIESAHSNGTLTINWDPIWNSSAGQDMLIVANLDGSSGVKADIQLGFKVPLLVILPYPLILVGSVLCLAGALLVRRTSRRLVSAQPSDMASKNTPATR
jgi:hypothetical protein